MKKKILAFMLCMLLVANPCLAASTGVVTVSGGSIATGGLSGGYSEKTESAALTLTMAMLYGLGVSVKLSQDAINAGKSAYSFVKGKFYEWVGGTEAEQLTDSQYEDLKSRFEVINSGSNIDPDGNIYFNATAVELLRRFCKWLDVNDYINNYSSSGNTPTVNGTLYTNSFSYYPNYTSANSQQEIWNFSENVGIVKFTMSNGFGLLFYTPVSGVTAVKTLSNSTYTNSYNLELSESGYYYFTTSYESTIYTPLIPESVLNIDQTSGYVSRLNTYAREYLRSLNGFNPDTPSDNNDGLNYDGDFDSDVLNNPDNNNMVVQPDLIPALQNENQGQQLNIPVEEYLEALKQILNQATNPQAVPEPIPAQDLPTLSPVPVEVPADLPLEWPVELPSSPDATPDLPTDNTPVTDPTAPVNPVDALPELTFNLDEYFPFCIPFDIYHLLSKFSADPVTPEFDIGFTDPFSNTQVSLHIDLEDWDGVAASIRTAELGAFIVGLAVASRSIFTRG